MSNRRPIAIAAALALAPIVLAASYFDNCLRGPWILDATTLAARTAPGDGRNFVELRADRVRESGFQEVEVARSRITGGERSRRPTRRFLIAQVGPAALVVQIRSGADPTQTVWVGELAEVAGASGVVGQVVHRLGLTGPGAGLYLDASVAYRGVGVSYLLAIGLFLLAVLAPLPRLPPMEDPRRKTALVACGLVIPPVLASGVGYRVTGSHGSALLLLFATLLGAVILAVRIDNR